MKLAIKSLSLSNFKGVKELNLMLDNAEIKLHGANGSGKTTVNDAYNFVLTGNDSTGSKCDTVTKDAENKKLMGTNEATVLLDIDGEEIKLTRKVVTKKGKSKGEEVEKTTYEYLVNDAPVKATEFEKYIIQHITKNEISSKEFLILTNPLAFQELPWEDQRNFLYKVVESITDEDVIAANKEFEFLKDFLKVSDIKTYRTTMNKLIKELELQAIKLQGVIEEKERTQAPVETIETLLELKEKREKEISALKESIKDATLVLDELREKHQLIAEIEAARNNAKREYDQKNTEEYRKLGDRLSTLKLKISSLEKNMELNTTQLKTLKEQHTHYDVEVRNDFKARWSKVVQATLREKDKICPTCGKELDEDKLQEVINDFEARRESKKKEMLLESEELKAKISHLETSISQLTDQNAQLKESIESCLKEKAQLEAQIALGCDFEPFNEEEYAKEIKAVQVEIEALKTIDTTETDKRIESLRSEVVDIDFKISEINNFNKLQDEIATLKADAKEKQLQAGDEIRKLELSKEFTKVKAEMLEKKINSMFDKVQFKLFETQKNGEVKETCTALAKANNGSLVDLKSGYANTALRIQAGIEIINALQKHFDFYCPIIVDNRESVTELPNTESQVISLIVSENDKELRIE